MMSLYAPEAVFIAKDGPTITDHTQIAAQLENDILEDVGGVDLVFDVIGGDIGKRSARLIRPKGTLVIIAGPPAARPSDGLAIDFVLVSDPPN